MFQTTNQFLLVYSLICGNHRTIAALCQPRLMTGGYDPIFGMYGIVIYQIWDTISIYSSIPKFYPRTRWCPSEWFILKLVYIFLQFRLYFISRQLIGVHGGQRARGTTLYVDWKVDSEIPFLRYGNHVVILLWFFWQVKTVMGIQGIFLGVWPPLFSASGDNQHQPLGIYSRNHRGAPQGKRCGTLGVSRPFQGPKLHPLRKRWENNHSGENYGKTTIS